MEWMDGKRRDGGIALCTGSVEVSDAWGEVYAVMDSGGGERDPVVVVVGNM
jgi:hypothetical protein